ncbi:MAG: PKD domain-containing protein [Cyclobacteriaceae bacterium]|nr:PKD domain-containing protein [Cyclobacteriaceae bacterium]
MKKLHQLIYLMILLFLGVSCHDEYNLNDEPPTTAQAGFSFVTSPESDNILQFTADNDFFLMTWDLGNGASARGRTARGVYPQAGTYTVSLTVFSRGGSATSTMDIVIEQTDPTLLDKPLYNFLTGGVDAVDGKTWVIDSTRRGHFGVGPNPSSGAGDIPEWYQAGPLEKTNSGLYSDRYTFFLSGFDFVMETNGLVYLNAAQGSKFPGAFDPGVGDLSAPYTAPTGLKWNIAEPENAHPILSISPGGFLGYYAGGNSYQVVKIEENELFLRYVDQANEGLAWYIRLIPAGFTPVQPDPEPLPDVDFTSQDLTGSRVKAWKLKPGAGAFGVGPVPGSDEWYPSGADISGERPCLFNDLFIFRTNGSFTYNAQGDIFGESYMGLSSEGCQDEANLAGKTGAAWASGDHTYSFTAGTASANPKITVTGTGAFMVLPKAYNGGEYSAGPPRANESVTYDVIGYNRETKELSITIDVSPTGGVFWSFILVPDETYVEEADVLTLNRLTGGDSKAWKLKPAAGAFGVGPFPGSDEWWPNGANISADRPCLFNDLFIFKNDGSFVYDPKGDIFVEDYMGAGPGGCQPVTVLEGTPGAAWGAGSHTFSFAAGNGGSNPKITVTGTGAFIALPKAFNGGEYSAGPPVANRSVTYDVIDYTSAGGNEEMTITIDISPDGGAFWSFVLIPDED